MAQFQRALRDDRPAAPQPRRPVSGAICRHGVAARSDRPGDARRTRRPAAARLGRRSAWCHGQDGAQLPRRERWRRKAVEEALASEFEDFYDTEVSGSSMGPAATATARMLDWGELCEFVAGFTQTSKGRSDILNMTPPDTQEESERLAFETNAAGLLEAEYAVQLNFGGVNTLEAHEALMRASRGGMLNGKQLLAVSQTIIAAQRLKRQIQTACRSEEIATSKLRPIILSAGQLAQHEEIVKDISYCIDDKGELRDRASPELEKARHKVGSLEGRVKGILGSYPGQAVLQGGRWCVAITDSTAVPARALVVGTSPGGVTYCEPQAAVPINNDISQARGFVFAAEEAVLWKLTGLVMEAQHDVDASLQLICWLDGITAKARFGNWIGGHLVEFSSFPKTGKPRGAAKAAAKAAAEQGEAGTDWLIHLRRLKHPLLLARYLKDMKKQGGGKIKGRALSSARERLLRSSRLAQGLSTEEARQAASNGDEAEETGPQAPVPSDLCIHSSRRALIITGPNTGGKTIMLKALGLSTLMARCGVPIPATHPAQLPCFSNVLADIGDEQSLSASLSTFSGHLKRIQDLRNESDSKSLILLDEVGTGTDPAEGTALGIALLRTLVKGGPGGAAFTMATTHMSALTSLKYSDDKFENASVEFNEEELRPTYRLLMGVPGRSNAINIASRLKLAPEVIDAARERMGAGQAEVDDAIVRLERLKQQAEKDNEECSRMDEKMSRVAREFRKLRLTAEETEAKVDLKKAEQINALVRSARTTLASNQAKLNKKAAADANSQDPSASGANSTAVGATVEGGPETTANREPHEGDQVFLPTLQKNATVVSIKGKTLKVSMGKLKMTVKMADVQLA